MASVPERIVAGKLVNLTGMFKIDAGVDGTSDFDSWSVAFNLVVLGVGISVAGVSPVGMKRDNEGVGAAEIEGRD